jgi:DNA-directed RNA polymerase specialized sigma24 family protein
MGQRIAESLARRTWRRRTIQPHERRERIVEVILTRLPREAAMLIRWIDLGEMTHEEVAAILRRPAATVKTQHRRARERFRALAKRLYKEDLEGGA